jgi:hypothetical protein
VGLAVQEQLAVQVVLVAVAVAVAQVQVRLAVLVVTAVLMEVLELLVLQVLAQAELVVRQVRLELWHNLIMVAVLAGAVAQVQAQEQQVRLEQQAQDLLEVLELLAQAEFLTALETQVKQELDTEMEVAVVAVAEQPQEQQALVAQVEQEQFLSTGKTIAESLPHFMYAVIQNGVVTDMSWEKKDIENVEYVLMTELNSPAWIGGKYQNGKFYQP